MFRRGWGGGGGHFGRQVLHGSCRVRPFTQVGAAGGRQKHQRRVVHVQHHPPPKPRPAPRPSGVTTAWACTPPGLHGLRMRQRLFADGLAREMASGAPPGDVHSSLPSTTRCVRACRPASQWAARLAHQILNLHRQPRAPLTMFRRQRFSRPTHDNPPSSSLRRQGR